MPPEAAFTFGLILGVAGLLLIQAFTRRKIRQALSAVAPDMARTATVRHEEENRRTIELDRLRERLIVLERIAIDPAVRTSREIERLRIEAG